MVLLLRLLLMVFLMAFLDYSLVAVPLDDLFLCSSWQSLCWLLLMVVLSQLLLVVLLLTTLDEPLSVAPLDGSLAGFS